MSDDLERTIYESLGRHAAQLGRPAGEIDDIYDRVTRRRHRRRAVAGVGSLAIAAVGVLGIATVGGGGGGERVDGVGAGALGVDEAWACTGYLGGDGVTAYYAECEIADGEAAAPHLTPCNSQAEAFSEDTAPATTMVDATFVITTAPATSTLAVPPVRGESVPPTTPAVAGLLTPITTATTTTIAPAPATWVADPCSPVTGTAPPAPDCATVAMTTTVATTTVVPPTIATIVPETTAAFVVPNCDQQEQTYTVVGGDSLYSIAALFSSDAQVIAYYNSWPEGIGHPLFLGDIVKIPPGYPIPYSVTATTAVVDTAPPFAAPAATMASATTAAP